MKVIQHFQNGRGVDAHFVVFREVAPADYADRINQKFGGPGDIGSVNAAVRVEQVPGADHFGVGIGEEEKRVTLLLTELLGDVGRVHADGNDADIPRDEFIEILLETP